MKLICKYRSRPTKQHKFDVVFQSFGEEDGVAKKGHPEARRQKAFVNHRYHVVFKSKYSEKYEFILS